MEEIQRFCWNCVALVSVGRCLCGLCEVLAGRVVIQNVPASCGIIQDFCVILQDKLAGNYG